MAIQELEVFPRRTWSESQGLTGTRKWVLDHDDNLNAFISAVCESHWPGERDSVPIQVQEGAFFNEAQVTCQGDMTTQTMGPLPKFNKTLVVATYALLRMTNCWPASIPKPGTLRGTSLNLHVRGSGQYLVVSPASIKVASPLLDCGTAGASLSAAAGTRIVVPVSEYQITNGRLTLGQIMICHAEYPGSTSYVPHASEAEDESACVSKFRGGTWDRYQGTVNCDWFLGKPPGTLLFDGYSLAESFVCTPNEPRRYSVTVCLKHRTILTEDGEFMQDEEGRYVGWNHDFVNHSDSHSLRKKRWGWKFITMWDDASGGCRPRYPKKQFHYMFGRPLGFFDDASCGSGISEGETTIDNFCINDDSSGWPTP